MGCSVMDKPIFPDLFALSNVVEKDSYSVKQCST